jgi:predicted anti-sigma-YlaC factor YlaD
MDEHVTEWLGAYLDGELHGETLERVKDHLLTCATCQDELAGLQKLSELLQEMPGAVNTLPANRFISNVLLQLPPRQSNLGSQIKYTIWGLVPVALLVALVFIQTLYIVNGLVSLTGQIGLFSAAFPWSAPVTTQNILIAEAAYLLNAVPGLGGQALIQILYGSEWLNNTVIIPLFIQVSLMLLFTGWLASWFVRRSAIPNDEGER